MIRIVGAVKSECERCPYRGTKPCAVVVREPSGAREAMCLTHTFSLIADLIVSLLVVNSDAMNS